MPGSHRGRPRRLRAFAPAALASVVAVVLVVAAIVGVDVFHHRGSSNNGSPTVSSSATLSATSPSSPRAARTPTPSVTPTTPKPTAPKTTPKPTHKAPAPIATPAPASTPVAVYNNSRVSHRASLASSRLRADGYPVTRTATRPTYPGANVVYYPAGNASLAAAARGVVARHIGIVAAEPRPTSIPAMSGLIVVVTSSYT